MNDNHEEVGFGITTVVDSVKEVFIFSTQLRHHQEEIVSCLPWALHSYRFFDSLSSSIYLSLYFFSKKELCMPEKRLQILKVVSDLKAKRSTSLGRKIFAFDFEVHMLLFLVEDVPSNLAFHKHMASGQVDRDW